MSIYFPHPDEDKLFYGQDIRDALKAQQTHVNEEVEKQNEEYILNVPLEEFVEYLVNKFRCNLPVLGGMHIADSETTVDLRHSHEYRFLHGAGQNALMTATEIKVHIPFEGDEPFFDIKPVTFKSVIPRGFIKNNEVVFSFRGVKLEPDEIKKLIDKRKGEIEDALLSLRPEVDSFNAKLPELARSLVSSRKKKILDRRKLAEAIGIPVKTRTTPTVKVPVVRKSIPLLKPKASTRPFTPDPTIEMEHYENIIDVICNLARGMEFSPSLFRNIEEEQLRLHFLLQLRAQYESVGGETFNGEGKTDILIPYEGGNLFIAECKYWRGSSVLQQAIDQLLGYVTWRDHKTALLIFCRNKSCSSVQNKLPGLVSAHPNFRRLDQKFQHDMGWRFIMANKNDASKEFLMTVLFFCVPCIDASEEDGA